MVSLDLGCGSHCRADIGIDIDFNSSSTEHLDGILEPYGFTYNSDSDLKKQDLNNLPWEFEDGPFNKVLLCHVLEHLKNPYLILKEIKRVLKEDGFLLIIVPDASLNRADWRDEEHLYSWTLPSLKHLVNKLFKIEESKVINTRDSDLFLKAGV